MQVAVMEFGRNALVGVTMSEFTLVNCGTTRRGGDASRLDRDTGGDGVMDSNADGAEQYTPIQ